MFANFVRQTHDGSGGSGSLTLVAVGGYPQFADVFGGSGTRLVQYAIKQFTTSAKTQLAQAETGLGSINLATGVLSRSKVLASWDGSTYVKVAPSALSFSSDASLISIDCGPIADGFMPPVPFWNTTLGSAPSSAGMPGDNHAPTGGTTTLGQYKIWIVPFRWAGRGEIVAAGFWVTTADAAGHAKIAVYDVDSAGGPGALIGDFGAVSLASTGAANVSGSLWLPPGWYFARVIGDSATAAVRGNGTGGAAMPTPLGMRGGGQLASQWYKTGSAGDYTATPDPCGNSGYTTDWNTSFPLPLFTPRNS